MIRIVTDSTSDIPEDIVRELDIVVVPTYVIIGAESYIDGVTISREEFYERLAAADPLPTTAAPSAGDFETTFRRLQRDGANEVVAILVAAALSGVQNAARTGASAVTDLNVTFVDSEQVSMGLGWQVIEAGRAAKAGKSVPEIVEAVERIRPRVRLYAALDTVEFVRRSGRVGWARAMIGQLLRIKPIVEVKHGEVMAIERTRTRSQMVQRLKELIAAQAPIRALTVLHSHALNEATKLADELRALYPSLGEPIHIVEATTVIGTHVGPNGLGVSCVTAD